MYVRHVRLNRNNIGYIKMTTFCILGLNNLYYNTNCIIHFTCLCWCWKFFNCLRLLLCFVYCTASLGKLRQAHVLVCLAVVIKPSGPKQHRGGKRWCQLVLQGHRPSLRKVWTGAEAEMTEECFSGLTPCFMYSSLSHSAQDHLPRNGTAHHRVGPPTSVTTVSYRHGHGATVQSALRNSSLRFPCWIALFCLTQKTMKPE